MPSISHNQLYLLYAGVVGEVKSSWHEGRWEHIQLWWDTAELGHDIVHINWIKKQRNTSQYFHIVMKRSFIAEREMMEIWRRHQKLPTWKGVLWWEVVHFPNGKLGQIYVLGVVS